MSEIPEAILRAAEVERRTGLSSTSLWRLRKAERFPQAVKLGERMIGWPASEVEAWLSARKAERVTA